MRTVPLTIRVGGDVARRLARQGRAYSMSAEAMAAEVVMRWARPMVWPTPHSWTVDMESLRLGMQGAVVLDIQKLLLAAGCDPGTLDGIFGGETDAALRRFQGIHDLTIDGAVTWPVGETADALRAITIEGASP